MRKLIAAAVVAGSLLLAGCSGGSGDSASSPAGSTAPTTGPEGSVSPTASDPSATVAPSGSASPSLPASACLTGTWTLVRFVAVGDQNTYGTGEGGDVTVTFTDKGYTLAGAAKKPITVTLAGSQASLTVDGKATGTYTLDGQTATFTSTGASGSGTLSLGGRTQTVPMDQVTSVIGLKGSGQIACAERAMIITLQTVRLEFGRL